MNGAAVVRGGTPTPNWKGGEKSRAPGEWGEEEKGVGGDLDKQ